jgi:hypothetical protein
MPEGSAGKRCLEAPGICSVNAVEPPVLSKEGFEVPSRVLMKPKCSGCKFTSAGIVVSLEVLAKHW